MELPSGPVKATRISPKIFIVYSVPKVGKTEELSKLPECMITDAEGGAAGYECLRVSMNRSEDVIAFKQAVEAKAVADAAVNKTKVVFPYKFIAMDTIDMFEEFAEISATRLYKESVIGQKFTGRSVLELPNGGGYYYLRNELTRMINLMAGICPHLIIVAHVKEKLLDKNGEQMKINDISLTGKMGSIVCAMADAIGYMYRNESKEHRGELWISFETYESTVMGARQKYLAGQKFPFSWDRIYPDELELLPDGKYKMLK